MDAAGKLKDVIARFGTGHGVVLELDLARGVLEARPSNPLQALQVVNATSLNRLRDALREAAADERVKGLVVHAVPTTISATAHDEIGQLVEEFGTHKPTLAWAESFGELSNALVAYKLATACHEVWVQPTGMLCVGGVEVQLLLLKGLLNKAGVDPQFGQRHEVKSAAETYAGSEISQANREMTTRLGQSVVDDAAATIARRRGIPLETAWQAINASPLTPAQAKELGLIDRVGYRDEAYTAALEEWGATSEELRYVHRYSAKPSFSKRIAERSRPQVGVVTLRGPIVTGRGESGLGGSSAGSDVVDEHLRAALRDDDIKAVLFEVESPGGSAVASDFIRRSVLRLREAGKPVVAVMGSLAASGGYYVSMGATEIVAQPTTLTGSIGVLGGKMVTKRLYEKLDLVREAIPIGASAGMLSSAQEFTEEDWARLDAWLDRVYLDFTTFAASDRGMDYDELEAVAKGRVWTGADAHQRGLVDHLGGHRLGLQRAAELAGLDPEAVAVTRVGDSGLLNRLIPAASSESRTGAGGGGAVSSEDLLTRVATWAGVRVPGPVSLPFTIRIR
ncbi:MAG TPA: S49 family peptidase [Arachnia sp.]|nr:S49 family peptidase [Arachnia sp.]HMT85190.1 S49 family peptidase [Arachnia sp.]